MSIGESVLWAIGLLLVGIAIGLRLSAWRHAARDHGNETIALLTATLEKFKGEVREFERARSAAAGALAQQLRGVVDDQQRIRSETEQLVRVLAAPGSRGRWGEIQLRRVVELAGMLPNCDFVEQPAGEHSRPDLVINLPGGRTVVVDAKAPMQPLIDALASSNGTQRDVAIPQLARFVRERVRDLSRKEYWAQFGDSPELVVLFLPTDGVYYSVLEHDPALLEDAVKCRILIATPTTLIGLLKAMAWGWRQERVAENAENMSRLGRDLYERLRAFTEHLQRVGKGLDHAVRHYNAAVGSLEGRVLAAARRFEDYGAATGADLPALPPLERQVRDN